MEEDVATNLRAHIQNILLDYALTHLTTDYIAYTHSMAEELLFFKLHPVTTTDPTSFVLEPSITQTIASTFGASQIAPYEERWPVGAQVLKYCRESHTVACIQHPSKRCWDEDLNELRPSYRPNSPMLTMRAIKETPKLGSHDINHETLAPSRNFLERHRIKQVDNEENDESFQLNLNHVLGNRLTIDDDTYRSANELVKCVGSMGRYVPSDNEHILHFLRAESPAHTCTELLQVPLFPRYISQGNASGRVGATHLESCTARARTIKDLPELLGTVPQSEDPEGELYKQHMVVIDGWQAFEFPSSPLGAPTPSLGSSSSRNEDIDELFLPSPPGTSYIQDLLDARMDDVEIPRADKLGGSQHQEEQTIGGGQSLPSFLNTFQFTQAPVGNPHTPTGPNSRSPSPPSAVSVSMLRQCGDRTELEGVDVDTLYDLPSKGLNTKIDDFEEMLQAMFQENLPKDPFDFILNEKLDEQESLLMDVPNLPPPTSRSTERSDVPTDLYCMLSPVDRSSRLIELSAPTQAYPGFLTRIKGLKSLNLELSWRPFNFGTRVPTHEEVSYTGDNVRVDCVGSLKTDAIGEDPDLTLSALLEGIMLTDSLERSDRSEVAWSLDPPLEEKSKNGRYEFAEGFVLTAAERRRKFGLPDPPEDELQTMYEEDLDVRNEQPPAKRIKRPAEGDPANDRRKLISRPIRSVRFQDDCNEETDDEDPESPGAFDDSGIYIQHPSKVSADCRAIEHTSVFAGLSDDAEGYEGPDEDGDVLPDIDPLFIDPDALDSQFDYCPPSWFGGTVPAQRLRQGQDVIATAFVQPRSTEGKLSQPEDIPILLERHLPGVRPNMDKQSLLEKGSATGQLNSINTTVGEEQLPGAIAGSPDHSLTLKPPSASRSLRDFMKLRLKTAQSGVASETLNDPPQVLPQSDNNLDESRAPLQVPSEILDRYTLVAPEDCVRAVDVHRYLASVDVIQKRALVRALSDQSVELVEREYLGDMDLILDQDTAVLFVPLRGLPARCETVCESINRTSWHFLHILVLFETLSSAYCHAKSGEKSGPVANPFSPPVVKAVKKLRRDLSIAEACDDKRVETLIHFSFPLTTDEAARAIRMYGDMAYSRDKSGGALWSDRQWLDADEEDADEQDLAAIDGMNVFAAAVILASITLDDFLAKTPQEKIDEFGSLIGVDRIVMFNRIIARRLEAMQLPSSSPPTTSLGTSNPMTPFEDGNNMADGTETQMWPAYA